MYLQNKEGREVPARAIAAFTAGFQGSIHAPGDAGYDAARAIWNASIDRHPGLIARCVCREDVIAGVNFARANDILVSIKSGGHNVAGRALCDQGLVIDLSRMNSVTVDPSNRTVRVAAGALLGEIDAITHQHGLAVPAGVVSKTGMAGLALGGGVGWLVRKYGLTCDNMLACEVITANGECVTASPEQNSDLFWALRGGGGNFGIVTSFLFQAHPVSHVLGGMIVYPRSEAERVIRHYRDFMQTAPDELTAYAALVSTPAGDQIIAVVVCYCGNMDEGAATIAPLRAFGTPLADLVQPMPFPAMQQLLDAGFPDGSQNYWKSTFLADVSDAAVATLVGHANAATSPLSATVLECYGGAAGRVGPTDTAYGQRHSTFNVGITAQWRDPAENAIHTQWARDLFAALTPYANGGQLLNFTSDDTVDDTLSSYGVNYERLLAIKNKFDATNFFSLNRNIVPAH